MKPRMTDPYHTQSRSALAVLILAAAFLVAWFALASWAGDSLGISTSAAAQETAPEPAGAIAMTMTVEAKTEPAAPGDMVTYTIELEQIGGTSTVMMRLSNTVPSGLKLAPKYVTVEEVSPGVEPVKVRIRGAIIDWLGSLDVNAKLRIAYPARVQACYSSDPLTITNTVVGQRQGGLKASRSAELQVDCHDAASADKVAVTMGFKGTDEELQAFVPGTKVFLHLEAKNTSPNPTVLGLQGAFPSLNFNIGMPPSLRRLPDLGWDGDGPDTIQAAGADTRTVFFQLFLKGNSSKQIDLPIWLDEIPAPDTEYVVKLGYCLTGDGKTCPGADPKSTEPPPSFQWIEPATLTVRYRDLGDAPDSTNHAAGAMDAYPSVQADFPTVFDPATGLPQGPAHLDPRPFHLGRRFSPESEADIGPDLDPVNNIRPAVDKANRDRRDDGLALFDLAFQDCSTTVLPVKVLIRPQAVATFDQQGGKGYLNAWLDGNRDGNWTGSGQCNLGPAPEHIVIDHEVDVVALGPGLHTIYVPTGLVPWPAEMAQRPAWLRLTLSEKPANKTLNTGGVAHGDGRGHTAPFALGETEDYLFRPPDVEGRGGDIQVQARTRLVAVSDPDAESLSALHGAAPAAPDISLNFEKLEVSVRGKNIGSKGLRDYRLRVILPPLTATLTSIAFDPNPAPGIKGFREGNTIIYDFRTLAPFEIPVTSGIYCLTCTDALPTAGSQAPYDVEVIVESDGDVNPDNDRVKTSLDRGLPVPTALWTDGVALPLRSGMTCKADIEVKGRYEPGATVNIFTDGFESGNVSAQATGDWSFPLNLADGHHRIGVVGAEGPFFDTLHVWVDTDLVWDPASLTFADSKGRVFRPFDTDGNGAQVANGWVAKLEPGETYDVSVFYCGDDAAPELTLTIAGKSIVLSDPDDDGFYEGSFEVPSSAIASPAADSATTAQAAATLVITSGDNVSTYDGTLQSEAQGLVYDAASGQPLAGATVTAFEVVAAGKDTESGIDLWRADDYGQVNPETTGAGGTFGFWAPSGVYQLEVTKAGYQSYRTRQVSVVDQRLSADIPLAPIVDKAAGYVIEISQDGFNPSVLRIRPGSVVRWVNVDADGHTTTSSVEAMAQSGAAAGGDWDSGLLQAVESFTVQLDSEGTYAYFDKAYPLFTGEIIVDVNAPAGFTAYLPMVRR